MGVIEGINGDGIYWGEEGLPGWSEGCFKSVTGNCKHAEGSVGELWLGTWTWGGLRPAGSDCGPLEGHVPCRPNHQPTETLNLEMSLSGFALSLQGEFRETTGGS